METNYVLLMGLFLLLVAVDCSSSDPKGNVNEKTDLNQNVDGTVDPVKENDDPKSVSDSIGVKNVKDNGGDQINGSGGDIGSDTSKSNLNRQSGSNEDENLRKDGKESNDEAQGKTGRESRGDNENKGKEESHSEALGKTNGVKGDNEHRGKEESHFEAGGKADGEKGDNKHKVQESNVESKGMTDSMKEGNNEHKGQEDPNVESNGTTNDKEGDNEHKGQEESNVEAKGKMDGMKEGDNVLKGQEESKFEANGKMDGDKEGNNVQKGQEEANNEAKGKTYGGKTENPDNSEDLKEVKSEKDITQDLVLPPPPPTWKDGFRGEECDPSNMCMDKNRRFAACLRVPGNESPDLSLLIQNKGKGPLTIKISAPAFVQLEETDVELQEKQDRKVKVSIKNSGIENSIVLRDGSGECSLDFKDFIVHNSAKSYVNFFSRSPRTAIIFVAAVMILASGWICMSLRRRMLRISNGLKYRRLDMALPVSGGAKPEPDINDGWDNSWVDNWDDEEAPMTPSMPLTPKLSSKGLASRRLSKEGWKD